MSSSSVYMLFVSGKVPKRLCYNGGGGYDTEKQRETYITVLKDNMLGGNEQLSSELYATCTNVPTSGSVSPVFMI